MTSETKALILRHLANEHHELQQLAAGEWPDWCHYRADSSPSPTLANRRMYADWCLKTVLRAVLPVLPRYLRVLVQACFDLREHIWSIDYLEEYYQVPRKQASPQRVTTKS